MKYLLKSMQMARSTYYFELSKADQVAVRNRCLADEIKDIFSQHKGRYGVRRVYQELIKRSHKVNHIPMCELFQEDTQQLLHLPELPFECCKYRRLPTDHYLKYCAGNRCACSIKLQTIASVCECSRSSVKRALNVLRDRGFIDIKGGAQKLRGKGHRQTCNRYYCLDSSEWKPPIEMWPMRSKSCSPHTQ